MTNLGASATCRMHLVTLQYGTTFLAVPRMWRDPLAHVDTTFVYHTVLFDAVCPACDAAHTLAHQSLRLSQINIMAVWSASHRLLATA